MRKLATVLFMVAWLAFGGSAWGAVEVEVEVEVIETWPAGDAVTIGANQNYYLRIVVGVAIDPTSHNLWPS